MKKHFKKILAVTLSVAMLLLSFSAFAVDDISLPVSLYAATSDKCGDNLTWSLSGDGTLTISGTGDMYDYKYKTVNGDTYLTTAPWGKYVDNLKKLVLNTGITRIGRNAFIGCSGLNGNLVIPDSVTSIGGRAFYNCKGFTGELVIPNGIEIISYRTFYGCRGLTGTIKIPNGVTTINHSAFMNCSNITDVIIPGSVTKIEGDALMDCDNLKTITIQHGNSTVHIDHLAFAYCNAKKIYIQRPYNSISGSPWCAYDANIIWGDIKVPPISKQYYYGQPVEPEIGDIINNDYDNPVKTLVKGIDYIVSYENNTAPGVGKAIITYTGKYAGYNDTEYAVVEFDIVGGSLAIDPIPEQAYTGEAITPKPVIRQLDNNGKTVKTLTEGRDYTLNYISNKLPGTATINITYKGDYEGYSGKAETVTFTIKGSQNYSVRYEYGNPFYEFGSEPYINTDALVLTAPDGTEFRGEEIGDLTVLDEYGEGYSAYNEFSIWCSSFSSNINTSHGFDEDFCNSATVLHTITILPFVFDQETGIDLQISTSIGKSDNSGNAPYYVSLPSVEYTGKPIDPIITEFSYGGTKHDSWIGELTYDASNNINVGTAYLTISGTNVNTKGSLKIPFEITPADVSGMSVSFADEDIAYQGEPCEPIPTVTFNGMPLRGGKDYTISYSNNNGEGTGTATITGIGNFSGTKTVDFEIKSYKPHPEYGYVDISNDIVEATIDGTFVYDGTAKEPKSVLIYHFTNPTTGVTIDYDMVEGTDYEIVSYANNVNAGTATITIAGIGTFENERDIDFTIAPCELSATTISGIPSYEYCKKDICPEPEIKIGDIVLTKNVDYTLEYENNRNRGTASVIIKGKGENLVGTVTKNFEITPRDGTKFTIIVWL